MNLMSIGGYEYSDYILSDTHGGNSTLHKREIEKICNDIIDKKLNDYNEHIQDLIQDEFRNIGDYIANNIYSALSKDVITTVKISSNDAKILLDEKKISQVFYNEIYNIFAKKLKNKRFTIK